MGNKLKDKRKELEMSIYDVSEKSGLSTTYISNLENNNRANPSKDVMEKIAKALGSSVPELFYE